MTGFPLDDTPVTDGDGKTQWKGNLEIADKLRRLADYLVIGGMEELKVAHFRRVADTIAHWPESMEAMRHEGRLRKIPRIGTTIQHMLQQYVDTGTCDKWTEWSQRVPESVLDLVAIPGLGVKTAVMMYQGYGIDGLPALERALENHRLGTLHGIGPKTVVRIRRHLEARARDEV